jgi:ATP-dependent helicase/nuclease subunit A
MKTTWTEPQKQVIEHRDGNLLVAAAAGSGKTAVLVEHVIRRLTDPTNPVSLQDLVVMTFTKAAA